KMKSEQRKPTSANEAGDHPSWRLAALVLVLAIGLLGFWILPLQGAIAWLLIMVFLLPLIIAGIAARRMPAGDYRKMYVDGLKQLPLLGPLLGLGKRFRPPSGKTDKDDN